jgi:hypothetical protein
MRAGPRTNEDKRRAVETLLRDEEWAAWSDRKIAKVAGFAELLIKHRAWTLLNKSDGSAFSSWEDFCETPEPYGWGVPWSKLQHVIKTALAEKGENVEKTVALGTVSPAQPPRHGPGRGKRKTTTQVEGEFSGRATEVEAERLRAINRAPEPAIDLFRRDLLSKGVAVAMGTTARDTDPQKAARIAVATQAALEVVALRRSRVRSTWAHWQIALAYASGKWASDSAGLRGIDRRGACARIVRLISIA